MTVDTWIQAGLALVGAGGGVVAARSARRTKRQENRDDFLAVTTQQGKAIERLEARVQRQENEAEEPLGRRSGTKRSGGTNPGSTGRRRGRKSRGNASANGTRLSAGSCPGSGRWCPTSRGPAGSRPPPSR